MKFVHVVLVHVGADVAPLTGSEIKRGRVCPSPLRIGPPTGNVDRIVKSAGKSEITGSSQFALLRGLFQLLVQTAEEVGAEEGLNGDVKAVAQLLDGGNCGAAIAAADDIVHRGLGDAAQRAQFVDGNIPFPA